MVELVAVLSLIFYVNESTIPDWCVRVQYTVYNYLMGWYTYTNLIEGTILIILSPVEKLISNMPIVSIFLFVNFSVVNPQTSVLILSSCFRLVTVLPPLY